MYFLTEVLFITFFSKSLSFQHPSLLTFPHCFLLHNRGRVWNKSKIMGLVWLGGRGEERSDPGMWFSGAWPGRGEAGRGEKKNLNECEENLTTANLNVSLTGREDLNRCWQRRWKKSHIVLKTSLVFPLLLRDSGSREVEPSCPSCKALYLTPHKFSLQECRVTAS